jgi:glycosyltransferase involved in cell wall biosynthesis
LNDPGLDAIRSRTSYQEAFVGTPLITVCIATYQRGQILCERTLPTVLRQGYPNWEAVIVGDGCQDDTAARIAALGDRRLRFYNRPSNGPYPEDPHRRWLVAGTYAANEAIARARGRWIAPINDDDEWSDDHLAVLLAEAQRTKAELVYGRMRVLIHGTGEETWFGSWPPQQGDFGLQAAIYHGDLRAFRFDITAHELGEPGDWNLVRRMLEAGVRVAFVPLEVGTYHVAANHSGQTWWSERARRRGSLRLLAADAQGANS